MGDITVTMINMLHYIKDQDTFAANILDSLDMDVQHYVATCSARYVLNLSRGIELICDEQNKLKKTSDANLPPVTPQQWQILLPRDLVDILHLHWLRILLHHDSS